MKYFLMALLCLGCITLPTKKSFAQETTLQGTLHISHGDTVNGVVSPAEYFVEEAKTKKFHKVEMNTRAVTLKDLRSGDTVSVRGKKVQGGFTSASLTVVPGKRTLRALLPGNQTFLVGIVNLVDATTTVTPQQINDIIFGQSQVAGLYNEMSYGLTKFTGMVAVQPVKINMTKAQGCQYYQWAAAADTELAKQGITLANYQHLVYIMPDLSTMCSNYWGYSTFGGAPSRSWIFKVVPDLVAHELGHALAAHHAGLLGGAEYADASDIMGYSGIGLRHFNAPHKHQMGWTGVVDVTASGIFTLGALETKGMNVLRIPKPDTAEYYYISFRQPIGFDKTLRTAYANLLNLHTYKGSGTYVTRFVRALDVGQTFTDATNHVTITVLSKTVDSVTLQITK